MQNLNDFFFIVPKDKEWSTNLISHKIENIFDFNSIESYMYISYQEGVTETNFILLKEVQSNNIMLDGQKEDLCLKICHEKRNYQISTSYHPYSMRQAHMLFQHDIDIALLEQIYCFRSEEIKQGYAYRKGSKDLFYPKSLEIDCFGVYYFSKTIIGSPEFFRNSAFPFLREKGLYSILDF